jgi:uncharacterized membrane protein YccF (DUF307 family)
VHAPLPAGPRPGTVGLVRTLLNIIWLVLCGFWMAVLYVIAGIVMCVLIITIPFGIQAFKLAGFMLWPFGRTVVRRPEAGAGSVIGNVLWVVLVGWELAIAHLVTAFALAITIIGIPLALGNLKLVPVSLLPFGRTVVPAKEAAATGGTFF